jgi:hypothetical protein
MLSGYRIGYSEGMATKRRGYVKAPKEPRVYGGIVHPPGWVPMNCGRCGGNSICREEAPRYRCYSCGERWTLKKDREGA